MRISSVVFVSFGLLIAPRSGQAAACNGEGVPEGVALAQAQCCPARNPGAYVSCAAHLTNRLVKRGELQASCKHLILKAGCPAATTTTTAAPETTTSTTARATTTTSVTETTATASTSTSSTAPPASSTSTTHPEHHTTTTTPETTTTTAASESTTTTSAPAETTTTTTESSTTSSTMEGGPTTTSSTTLTTTTAPGITSTTTTTLGPGPEPGPHEICGNCIDDDANGLTDFEDPACCAGVQSFAMAVRLGKLKPHRATTGLRLKTTLAETGLADMNPLKRDVFLQIRPAGGTEALCAKIPADKFMRMHGAFKFWDHKHTVASAKGIDDLTVKVRRDGSVRLRTVGRHVQFRTPQQSSLQVTVGFFHPAGGTDTDNRCSTQTRAFRTGRQGRLLVP